MEQGRNRRKGQGSKRDEWEQKGKKEDSKKMTMSQEEIKVN